MAFKRLATPAAKNLNNFMSSDVRSGNNPAGQGTSVGTQYMSWPYDPAGNKDGGEVEPKGNPVVPKSLNNTGSINKGLN